MVRILGLFLNDGLKVNAVFWDCNDDDNDDNSIVDDVDDDADNEDDDASDNDDDNDGDVDDDANNACTVLFFPGHPVNGSQTRATS